MDKTINSFRNYPDWLIKKWQEIADLIVELLCVPAALIMKTENEIMEVFISGNSENNPYHVGDKEHWHGLYCETVIKNQEKLLIPNATKDKKWDKNPDIQHGMISYLGFPINFPDNKPFGTICVLDNKENSFSKQSEKLLLQFKNVIELDLSLLQSIEPQTNYLAIKNKEHYAFVVEKNIELQKAKDKVEASESLYKSLFENMSNSSSLYEVIMDRNAQPYDYRYLAINPSYEKNIGLGAPALIGKTLLEVFPSTEQVWLEKFREVVLTGLPSTIESYSKEVDKYFELIIYVPQKGLMAMIGSDITDRKRYEFEIIQAKEKAEESNANIQAIIENSINSIWAINSNYEITYINHIFKDEYFKSFGVKLEMGDSVITTLPEPIQNIWKERYNRVLNNENITLEDKIELAPNTFVYVKVTMTPIISNGKIIGASVFGNNITEQKKQEQDLVAAKEKAEESEILYRKMNENSPLGMHFYKLEDNERLIFVGANPAADRLLRIDNSQFIGKTIEEAFPPLAQTEVPERYRNAALKGISWSTEQVEYDDKKIAGAFAVKAFQTTQGNMVAIFEDITKRKQAEFLLNLSKNEIEARNEEYLQLNEELIQINQELIKAREKAEESDKLKTAFLQNMSHEIRTPLNAICGFSGMLNKPELSNEKRNSFVSIIENSSNQLLSIVSDILTISSLETKQEKLNINKVCINNVILDLLAIFKQQAINQNISLYAKQELNDEQSEIYSDKTKITQIFTNLLSNAIKFTHEGFIEFGYAIAEIEHAQLLKFYVKDTGIGIKPEFHNKIFERFRQADLSINKKYGGTGLGLAISKSLTELLGGNIWVESEQNKGSTFYFTIPYKPVSEIGKNAASVRQNENSRTILVAEDEEYNYLYIEELLLDMDIKLIHTKDGKETVEIYKSNPTIDLILMDIKMPVMDGYKAAKIIKGLNPDLPIIAQSAYALEHELEKYGDIFDDYITKPINPDDLTQKVIKYIDIQNNK